MDVFKNPADNALLFKTSMAMHFLENIPDEVPGKNMEFAELEADIEGFLFFSSSAIDIVKRKINDKFRVFDKKNVFYIHGLRKHLTDSGKQGKVKATIADFFTTPTFEHDSIVVKKSSLWKLQSLRNQAMHGFVIKIGKGQILMSYTLRNRKNYLTFTECSDNPHEYFSHMYDQLNLFIATITEQVHAK